MHAHTQGLPPGPWEGVDGGVDGVDRGVESEGEYGWRHQLATEREARHAIKVWVWGVWFRV
jgi:hypothetical protein